MITSLFLPYWKTLLEESQPFFSEYIDCLVKKKKATLQYVVNIYYNHFYFISLLRNVFEDLCTDFISFFCPCFFATFHKLKLDFNVPKPFTIVLELWLYI